MRYGEAGDLAADAAQTPVPAGIKPEAHAARLALAAYRPAKKVTPLFAATERPWEHVTAGAPLAPGPTNPMAIPAPGAGSVTIASVLANAAAVSGSPSLKALADRATAVAGIQPGGQAPATAPPSPLNAAPPPGP